VSVDDRNDYAPDRDAYGGESDPREVYDDDLPGAERYDAYGEVPSEADDEGGWDEGLLALLFIGGLALFLFPEPATSTLGLVLVGVAVVGWATDRLR
jgi:hypothetical protein